MTIGANPLLSLNSLLRGGGSSDQSFAPSTNDQALEELGLTEASLAQLSPEERRAPEDKVRKMIEEKIRQAMNAPDSNAAMLQGLMGV